MFRKIIIVTNVLFAPVAAALNHHYLKIKIIHYRHNYLIILFYQYRHHYNHNHGHHQEYIHHHYLHLITTIITINLVPRAFYFHGRRSARMTLAGIVWSDWPHLKTRLIRWSIIYSSKYGCYEISSL